MYKKIYLLTLILGTQCSMLPIEEKFLTDIAGEYKDFRSVTSVATTYITEFSIPTTGNFTAVNQKFTVEQILSETNAIYLVDDTTYIGLYIDKNSLQLKFITSTNGTKNGVKLNPTPKELYTLSSKK